MWDAVSALRFGLVDQLGGMEDAVDWIAEQADIENYGISRYPNYENSLWDFLPEIMNMQLRANLSKELGEEVSPFLLNKVVTVLRRKPVQALMPEMTVGFYLN